MGFLLLALLVLPLQSLSPLLVPLLFFPLLLVCPAFGCALDASTLTLDYLLKELLVVQIIKVFHFTKPSLGVHEIKHWPDPHPGSFLMQALLYCGESTLQICENTKALRKMFYRLMPSVRFGVPRWISLCNNASQALHCCSILLASAAANRICGASRCLDVAATSTQHQRLWQQPLSAAPRAQRDQHARRVGVRPPPGTLGVPCTHPNHAPGAGAHTQRATTHHAARQPD